MEGKFLSGIVNVSRLGTVLISMEDSPLSEARSRLADQEILYLSPSLASHYCIRDIRPTKFRPRLGILRAMAI
jgi:hypothetical protein